MKNLILIISVFLLGSCASKKYQAPLTAQVNVISEDPYKTIELRSAGFGKSKDDAYNDAETKAFEIIFFRGIPNTSVETPIIGSKDSQITRNHESYFKEFFNTRYKSFIMSSFQASPPQKNKGVSSAVVDVKINLMSLKQDLEDHGVRRKFGL